MALSKENLFLFTNNYPFNPGEDFIDPEIKYLDQTFNLVIIPTSQGHKTKRNISKTITVDSELAQKMDKVSYLSRFVYTLISLIWSRNNKFSFKDLKGQVIEIFNTGFKSMYSYKYISKKYKNELEAGAIVYSYWMLPHGLTLSLLKKRFSNSIYFSRVHNYDLYSERRSFGYIPYQSYIAENLDYIFPCSIDGATYLQNKFIASKDKIHTKYLGVENLNHNDEYNTERVDFSIISISSLVGIKRVKLIAESILLLANNTDKKIKWIHIGSGVELDGISSLLKKSPPNLDVDFLGQLTHEDVFKYLSVNSKNLDCFINLSEFEGLPVTIMEALSFNLPVILCDSGSMKEQVINNCNGILLKHDIDPNDGFQALRQILMMNSFERLKYREISKKIYLEKFNAEQNYTDFCKLIKESFYNKSK